MENEQEAQAIWDELAAEKGHAPAEQPQQAEPEAKVEPVAQVEVKTEPEVKPAPTTEELLQQALARVEKLEGRTRNVEGHIGGLTRNQNEIRTTLQAAQAAQAVAKEAPTDKQVKEALANPSEWEALKADFPEWSAATEKLLDAKLSQVRGGGADIAAIEKMVNERVTGQTQEIKKQIVDSALEAVFPGWQEEVNTEDFSKWINGQPPEIQSLTASDKVGDAAKLLRLFDKAKSESPTNQILEQRKQKLAAAAAAPRGIKPSAVKSVDQMTPAELWAYEARQREKRKASLA